jgi:hypothetical protein
MRRLLALMLLSCVALPAGAVVRRCVAQDGTLVFTDRRCADIGAVERMQPDAAAPSIAPVYRAACPRTLRDLVDRLRMATDSRDVNQLSSIYQWNGQSTRAANSLMDRLQEIVDRPLLDIGAMYAGGGDEDAPVPTHRPLVGLRLEQTLADGVTPTRTVLGVRRSMGCWWVSL